MGNVWINFWSNVWCINVDIYNNKSIAIGIAKNSIFRKLFDRVWANQDLQIEEGRIFEFTDKKSAYDMDSCLKHFFFNNSKIQLYQIPQLKQQIVYLVADKRKWQIE